MGRKTAGALLDVQAVSHNGMVRKNNEDNLYLDGETRPISEEVFGSVFQTGEGGMLAVCDGMGGEAGGELASDIAVKCMAELHDRLDAADPAELPAVVGDYVNYANAEICRELGNSDFKRGGTTFALAYIREGRVYCFSLGDTRIYYHSRNGLFRITEDHTVAMQKYKAGIYTLEMAEASADQHALTLFLGMDVKRRGLEPQVYEPFELPQGSKLLICSDGLHDMVSESDISAILSSGAGNFAGALAEAALERGGRDNITCIVVTA